MDTKFSTAIHSLILISKSKTPHSSLEIAQSVGTNPSYIRKVLGLLKKEGIISSSQGKSGFDLNIRPENLTLLKIYKSINTNPFFDIHKNPNDECLVGNHIQSTLNFILKDLEKALNQELGRKTLSDCIKYMKEELTEEEKIIYANF